MSIQKIILNLSGDDDDNVSVSITFEPSLAGNESEVSDMPESQQKLQYLAGHLATAIIKEIASDEPESE